MNVIESIPGGVQTKEKMEMQCSISLRVREMVFRLISRTGVFGKAGESFSPVVRIKKQAVGDIQDLRRKVFVSIQS
jgi:hypothetical protein